MPNWSVPLTRTLFQDSIQRLGGHTFDDQWEIRFDGLLKAYALRPYHSWHHVRRMLGTVYSLLLVEEESTYESDPALLALAVYYHDAIYDSRTPKGGLTNEEASHACYIRFGQPWGR